CPDDAQHRLLVADFDFAPRQEQQEIAIFPQFDEAETRPSTPTADSQQRPLRAVRHRILQRVGRSLGRWSVNCAIDGKFLSIHAYANYTARRSFNSRHFPSDDSVTASTI